MRDFIEAMIGGRHCGWCNADKTTFFERRFNGYYSEIQRRPLARLYWRWMDFNHRLGIWKLGQEWHWKHHV